MNIKYDSKFIQHNLCRFFVFSYYKTYNLEKIRIILRLPKIQFSGSNKKKHSEVINQKP